jgi:hypothetical protein
MSLEKTQELNYTVFHSAFVKPMFSLHRASAEMGASRVRASCFAQASAMEGICWTELGAFVGYFPTHVQPDLNFSPRAIVGSLADLEKFTRDWGYLFDAGRLAHLRKVIAGKRARFTPDLTTSLNQNSESAHKVFDACFLRALYLSRTRASTAATTILDFDRPDDIGEFLSVKVTAQELAKALSEGEGIDRRSGDISLGSLYAGLGELINALDSFRQIYEELPADDGAHTMYRKIAQLLRWRFHFIETKSSLYEEFIKRYLDVLGVDTQEPREQFIAYVDALADHWRGVQGPALAAPASA